MSTFVEFGGCSRHLWSFVVAVDICGVWWITAVAVGAEGDVEVKVLPVPVERSLYLCAKEARACVDCYPSRNATNSCENPPLGPNRAKRFPASASIGKASSQPANGQTVQSRSCGVTLDSQPSLLWRSTPENHSLSCANHSITALRSTSVSDDETSASSSGLSVATTDIYHRAPLYSRFPWKPGWSTQRLQPRPRR